MKYINFTVFIVPLLLLITACSSNKLITVQSPHHEKSETLKQALCIYKKEKGIAEVIAVSQYAYKFKFYLGDDIFEISKEGIVSKKELRIGDEFRAVKEIMVNKTNRHDCLPVEFHLIP